MRSFRKRKNWFERLSPEEQERYKWAIIAQHEHLVAPGEKPTVAQVRRRFEEKLYPPKDAA